MVPVATGATTEVWRHSSRAMRVGEVQLDDRPVEGGQRVVQGPGVVGEGARVDDDGGAPAPGAVHRVDELALVVRLEVLDARGRGARRRRPGDGDVVVEGGRAVDRRARARRAGSGWGPTAAARRARRVAPDAVRSRSVPLRRRTASIAASMSARSHTGDLLDAVRAVEHERDAVERLLVPAHQLDQLVVVEPGGQRRRAGRRRPPPGGARPPRSASMRPRRWASSAAKTSPTATASPWRRS